MAALDNEIQASRAFQDANFGCVQKCETCCHFSKSIFVLTDHVTRHDLPPKLFNCWENCPEHYRCVCCDFKTHTFTILNQHVQQYHRLKGGEAEFSLTSFICRKCYFETYSRLHWLKHSTTECARSKVERTSVEVEKKRVVHENSVEKKQTCKWYQCYSCMYETKLKSNFNRHILRHKDSENSKWYKCALCDYKTVLKENFKRHILNKHTKPDAIKWFKCELCDYKAKAKHHLKKHMRCIHKNSEHRKCNNGDAIKTNYQTIENNEKNDELRKCEYCNYKTKIERFLQNHMLHKHIKVEVQKWYKCHHCKYETNRKWNLDQHTLNKHTNPEAINWFKCELCDYKAKIRGNIEKHMLNKHLLNSEEVKRYKCDYCNYESKVEWGLSKHILYKHTNPEDIKWRQCEQCAYKSKDRSNMKRHVFQKHHEVLK